jgi:hypothetical protein
MLQKSDPTGNGLHVMKVIFTSPHPLPCPAPLHPPTDPQWKRWHKLCDSLAGPHVELTIEEFAPVLATFRALQRSGAQFDPMLIALLSILERQVFFSLEDSDDDADLSKPRPAVHGLESEYKWRGGPILR